jgi:hypothetical protein
LDEKTVALIVLECRLKMGRKRCSCLPFHRLLLYGFGMLILGRLVSALLFHWRDLDSEQDSIPDTAWTGDELQHVVATSTSKQPSQPVNVRQTKFYILPLPEMTNWLLGNYTNDAVKFYETTLNEQQAEIWLHRAFDRMSYEQGRTLDISEADVVLIFGYLHFNSFMMKQSGKQPKRRKKNEPAKRPETGTGVPYPIGEWVDTVVSRINDDDKSTPHVLMVPTWNPGTSRQIGIAALMKQLKAAGVNMWSLGFERNTFWQHVEPERIIPVPYVVEPNLTSVQLQETIALPRTENFVFYSGDVRKHAFGWSGCNRSMVLPLANRTDMYVRIGAAGDKNKNRLSQDEYNHRMYRSDYCLLLCGDTPTSRSLASAMLHGCVPVRVGSRLRGLCDPPCRPGWGWTVAGAKHSHLPYADRIDWDVFPEVNEADFSREPAAVLQDIFTRIGPEQKTELRAILSQTQRGWLYGLGNPVNSTDLGDAALYILDSIVQEVELLTKTT